MKHSAALLLLVLALPVQAGAQPTEPATDQLPQDEIPPTAPVVVPEEPWRDDGRPWMWFRQAVAVAYGPLGLLSTTRLQVRGALGRSEAIVFQDTYAGAGVDLAISPAFIQFGPRLSLAPIDVFDVDFLGAYTFTWKGSSGLLPYAQLGGTLDSQRDLIKTSSIAGHKFTLSISPTVKFKVGPVIGLWNVEWAFIHHIDQTSSRYVYEALRDLVIARDDLIVTNIAAILVEALSGSGPNGGPGPRLRIGAITRDKQSLVSRDISTALGGAVMFKPGPKPGWPDILLAVMGYLRDDDRAFKAPNIQLQLSWVLEKKMGKARAVDLIKDVGQ